MLRFSVGGLSNPFRIAVQNAGVGVGHENGGMRGDEKLGILVDEVVDSAHKGQLAGRGESSFRLVEDVESLSGEAIHDERKERLPVRLFVERPRTIRVGNT